MAKESEAKEENLVIDLGIEIKKHAVDEDMLTEFLDARKQGDRNAQGSLVEYVQERFYGGQNVVVVPDLSNKHFEPIGAIENIDFTGCKLNGAYFHSVNLQGSTFCDADLSQVTFWNCKMKNVDMRGADLSGCKFDGYGANWMKEEERNSKFEGMKFSSTEGLLDQYIKKNQDIYNQMEQEFVAKNKSAIEAKGAEINAAWSKLGYWEASYVTLGRTSGNEEYDNLVKEKQQLERAYFKESEVPYIVTPSLTHVMNAQRQFDPGYIRGSDKAAREQEKQYVRMERKDVEAYLAALKDSPSLTINQFAQDLLIKKGEKVIEGAKIIADCSARKSAEGSVEQEVLSDLNFANANLQEACFSGAVFKNCNFTGANLDKAIVESADFSGTRFDKTSAKDTNFFYCNMQEASVTNCDFKRAFLRGSDATEAKVENANFDYANIRNGKWDGVKIENATFNYADLEGVSLARADMRKVQMQHAILDNAIMNNCRIIESDLSNAFMQQASLVKANIQNSIFDNIKAPGLNLSEAELDKLVSMQEADLKNAILEMVKAEGVNFTNTNMEAINGKYAKLNGAILADVNASFSNLRGAELKGVDAKEIKLTGANLQDIDARESDFTKAQMDGIEADRANFTKAILNEANLRGSKLNDAILEKIEARRVDLRNAELERAKLNEANLEQAKVNDATNMHAAEVKEVKGNLIHEDINGKETAITAGEQVRRSDEIHKAEQKSTTGKIFGKIAQGVGGFFQKASEYVKQPFSSKTGRIVGAVIGAVMVVGIAVTAVATAGLSLAVGAAVVAGVVAAGAAVGAVGGHFAAKKIGMTSTILAAVGTFMVPGIGTGIGLAAGFAGNQVIKNVTGKTVDEHVANGINKAGQGLEVVGNNIGVTKEQEALMAGKEAARAQYKAPEKSQQLGPGVNFADIRLQHQETAKQSALGKETAVKSIDEQLAKNAQEQETKSKDSHKDKIIQTAVSIGSGQDKPKSEATTSTATPNLRKDSPGREK